MSDINTNISVNIDTSGALGQLKALQRQISTFHTSIAKSSQTASLAQADLQKNFLNAVNGIGAFSAELRTVKTSAENFTSSLEKNKFSMREYFRYAGGATQTFGRLFRSEFETINKVATENVKNLQTQYIKMGRDANGAMKAIAVRPLTLDMQNLSTQTQIAAQKQALFNQLVKQGSTNLLNFGKNTQWAGRQLMVGFTLPLMALGTAASKTFMEMEAAALKFKKVYGDLFTAPEETQAALDGITELAQGFTQYGIAVSKTIGLASEAAAAGFAGVDLQRQTTAATKLSVLGQIEQQQALETTISLQNAMGISSQELAASIDFLNAVENQTVTSLDDITIAIPKVAPVIKSLGGDVKDLAFFMTAMKEGGINASEGANALKSGLASMINPAKKSAAMLADMGININGIVEKNRGNLRATVVEFAQALDRLDPLSRARAIEQMFGKFQFARLSTLFQNVIKDGTQAERVLKLAGSSVEELASLSDKELGMTADSAMNKFKKSVEDLKFALVPVGKVFLEVVTPFLEKISALIEKFNGLSDSTKKIITLVTVGVGAIAPVVLMTIGLLANFVANGIKGLMILRNGYLRLTGQSQILGEQTNYLTVEQQQALAAAHSLEQSHARLTQTFTVESTALGQLKNAYIAATTAANNFAMKNPGMMVAPVVPTKRATGKPAVVGGTGNRDTELALLTPGETVIPAPMSEKYGSLINGMIADNIPGYKKGKKGESVSGTITKDPSNVKKDNRLYASPKIIGAQTDTMEWSTLEAEKKAIELATRGYLETLGESAEEVQKKIDNLQRVQASHINKEVDTKIIAGEALDIKQWNAPNLQADLGAINNFLNVVPRIADTLDDSKIAEMAGKLNITVDEFKTELSQLQQGIHPTTEKSADVLLSVAKEGASVDPSTGRTKKIREELEQAKYQSLAAEAVLTKRKEGDYYATLPTRAYDPAKDIAVAQDVANRTAKTQQALLSSFNISDEIAQISGKNAQALQNAWNALSVEQKEGLLRLKDDANAFTSALLNEAKEAGVAGFELGNSAIQGISKGIQDGSPSKKARQKGKNVSDGFEQGILEGMDDASLAGSQVGNAAVNSLASTEVVSRSMGAGRGASRPQGPVPIGPVIPTGASLLPLIAAPIVQATEGLEKSIGVSASKLGSLNKGLNSVSFGLTAAAGAGTMFGGKIGEVSAQIFKYSGLMFGLMQITQLLTQAQAARLIAERAATAGILTKTVTDAATNQATFKVTQGLFSGGIKQLIPNLKLFGKMIGRFLGPIGLAISAVMLLKTGFDAYNRYQESARLKVEGLGDAALAAGEKIAKTFEYFGAIEKKFAFENYKATGKDTSLLPTGQAGEVQKLIESDWFAKEYSGTINSIVNSTKEETTLALQSFAMQLQAKGLPTNQVSVLIDAILKEAGKKDIFIDFKNLNISTEKGKKAFEDNIDATLTILNKKLKKGLDESYKKTLVLAARTIAGSMGALQLKLTDGEITAEQYAASMKNINAQILAIKDSAQQNNLIDTIFKSMGKEAIAVSKGISGVSDRMLALQAIMLGVNSSLIQGLASTDLLMKDMARRGIERALSEALTTLKKFQDAAGINKNVNTTDTNKKALTAQEKLIKILEAKKKALEEEADAYAAVNDEIDRRFEYQQRQMKLDKDITDAKISGNYIEAAILSQEKLLAKSQFDTETKKLEIQSRIDAIEKRIDELSNDAKLTAAENQLIGLDASGKNTNKDIKRDPKKPSTPPTTVTSTDLGIPEPTVPKPVDVKVMARKAKQNRSNPFAYGNELYFGFNANGQQYAVLDSMANWYYKVVGSGAGKMIVGKGNKFAKGGKVQAFEPGGKVSGPGTSTSDSIPAYLSDGEYVFSAKAVDAAGGPGIVDGWHNALRRAKGGEVITSPRAKKPGVPYSRSGAPTGNPFGQYWGELSRFIGPRSPGMDIWGGTEIPGLKFTGKYPQHSDYMHQMLEQPRKPFSGPGMGIDKDPMRLAGSGASMGGIGNGAYGLGPLMFAKGGPVGANKFGLGKPDPKQSVLNNFLFGQKYVGGNSDISKSEIPFGPGGISKIIAKLGYKPVNLFNQYMNYFKAKKMQKNGLFHGSADLGRNSDGPFSGTTKLVGDYGNDPYHGMGFYATTSKSEADMYAGGYNVLGQWGESYGSMNKVTKLPFGKYLDFTKDLKAQNYGMWEMFQSQRDKGFLGAHEKLGSIMNDAGMTGAIMPRISSGMGPEEIMLAKWIALNKPKGTMLEEIGLGFAKGGPVGGAPHSLGMSSMGSQQKKKPSLWSKIVHRAMKAIDPFKGLGYNFLGGKEVANVFSGTGSKTDYLSAALTPLGIGKVGKLGKLAGDTAISSTKASTKIMRNLHNAMVESAVSSGRQVPNLTAPDQLKLSTSMLDEASDHGAAFRKYWGKAYEILAKSKNPVIDGMSQDDFFKSIVGNSENALSRWSGDAFSLSSGPSASQIDNPSDFIKAANAAYLQAHGLSSSQSLAMFRAVRAPGNFDSLIDSYKSSDPSLTPEQIFSSTIAHELGGYWSLSSKMGASYLRNLGITRSSLAGKPYGGLYRADVPADAFPTPIGMGGMMDEYANVFNPATIDSLRSATRVGSGWENLLKGPKRSTVLSNFYKTAPIPAKGQIAPEALEKLKTILSDSELRQLLKMMKDSSAGRSISLSAPFMSAPMAGSRWNEHEGLTHMMNLIRKAEEALGQSILIPKMANGGMVKNKISGANYKLPSYDVGIGYVPEDQIAQLHKGERVLTAEENKNFSTSGPVTNIININGSDLNKKEIAEAVMVELDRAQKKNNKSNRVQI